ncbi:MAG: hypothetical protein OXH99_12875 [Bryobacterales bacterium]|nr:hypothetical protein [Bryobacterales bacterium]
MEESHGLLAQNTRLPVNFAATLPETDLSRQPVMPLERLPAAALPQHHFKAGLMLAGLKKCSSAARDLEPVSSADIDPN